MTHISYHESIAKKYKRCCYYRTLFIKKRWPIVDYQRYRLRYFFGVYMCDCGCHELER